jgi:nitrate reductase NapAB chaperone NapD
MRPLPDPQVHVSGLLVAVQPGYLDAVERRLAGQPGLDVHVRDLDGSRLVVTLESRTLESQQAAFAALAGTPGVMAVNVVCHYVDEPGAEPMPAGSITGGQA